MSDINRFNMFNEDGKKKTKEDFLKEVAQFYDTVPETDVEPLRKILTSPENKVSEEELLGAYESLDRRIYLDAEITGATSRDIVEKIQFWNAEDDWEDIPLEERAVIQIFINSPGGSLIDSFGIINAIKLSKTPVHTVVYGEACSGAFLISICGHKRYAYNDASFLFHEGGTSSAYHDAHKFNQFSKFYEKVLARLKRIVIENTEIDEKTYTEHQKDDWYLDTEEALKYKIIDEICNHVDGGMNNEE